MAVGELIKYLSTFPSNAEVQIDGEYDISISLKYINDIYCVVLRGINDIDDKGLINEHSS